jgi:signal peptidase II
MNYLLLNGDQCLINNFLYLTEAYNKGVAWGMFQSGHDILIYVIPLIIIGLPVYIYFSKTLPKFQVLLFGLILGGALGNYYDRIFIADGVRDFIDVKLYFYDFPIFNVADAFISCSVIILFFISLFQKEEKTEESVEK